MPGTLSAIISTGELGTSFRREVVCPADGVAVLVELDQEGYVVCHWPLSYGVFEAEGVDVTLEKEVPVENVKVEVYEVDEGPLSLLDAVGSEYDVLMAEELMGVFENDIETEAVGITTLVEAELAGNDVVLEESLREGVEGVALLEEDSAAKVVDKLELDLVVAGSGTSTVTVGELTSTIE